MINIIVYACLAIAIFDLAMVVRSTYFLKHRADSLPTMPNDRYLVVVLAVYEEADTIEDTISFLESDTLNGVAQVIIVGNARERDGTNQNPTLELARSHLTRPDFITVVECDAPEAIKAHQVNYAASQVKTDPSKTWLYVMDVDTRFTEKNISLLREAISNGHTIIQQHTHFLEGYSSNSLIGKSFAAHQTRWTLAHEFTRIWLFNKFQVGVYHLVGHGMCIKCETFKDLGGFCESVKIEDIHFGYMCCMKGHKVHSISLLEGSDTPTQVYDLWKQQYGWSLGAFQILLYWRLLLQTGYTPTTFNYFQNIFCIWNYVRWLGQSAFIWFMLFTFVVGNAPFASTAFFLVYVTSFVATAVSMKRQGFLLGSRASFVLLGVLNSLVRSLPVMHCFVDQIRNVERQKYKTRHRKL